MRNNIKKIWPIISWLILIFIAGFFIFYNLGADSLQSWDEGIYTLIYQDVSFIRHGPTLTLHGEPWFEKPPLGFWLNGGMLHAFGNSEFVIRFLPSLFSLGAVLICYLLGMRLFNRTVGFLSALTLAVSPVFLYDHISRRGDLEGGFLFLTLLVMYYFVKSWSRASMLVWCSVFLGVAFMYRGALSLLSVLVIGLVIVVYRLWKQYPIRIWLWSAVAFGAIVVPWYAHQYAVHGVQFLKVHIGEHVLKRAGTPFDNHGYPWNYYLSFVRWKMGWVWVVSILGGVAALTRAVRWKADRSSIFLVIWILVFFVSLSFARTKLYWYVTPTLPALILLVISFGDQIIRSFKQRIVSFAVLAVFALVFISYSLASFRQITRPQKDSLPAVVEKLEVLSKSEPITLVSYDVQSWMRGWLEPQAEYYLRIRHPEWNVLNVDKKGLQKHLGRGNEWFLTSKTGLDEFNSHLVKDFDVRYFVAEYYLISSTK